MNLKKLFSIIISGLFALTLASCDFGSDEGGGSKFNEELLLTAMDAIDAAEDTTTSAKSIVSKVAVPVTYNYTGDYWSVTGSYEYDDVNTYPITIDMTFTWTGYQYEDIQLQSGSVVYYAYFTNSSTFTLNYTGSFVLIYNGETYNITWNIDYSSNGVTETFTGTYSVNGENYTWNASY